MHVHYAGLVLHEVVPHSDVVKVGRDEDGGVSLLGPQKLWQDCAYKVLETRIVLRSRRVARHSLEYLVEKGSTQNSKQSGTSISRQAQSLTSPQIAHAKTAWSERKTLDCLSTSAEIAAFKVQTDAASDQRFKLSARSAGRARIIVLEDVQRQTNNIWPRTHARSLFDLEQYGHLCFRSCQQGYSFRGCLLFLQRYQSILKGKHCSTCFA